MKRFTVRAFFDGMNRILEKEAKEALAAIEFRVKAELLPERMPIGQACLWSVLDEEGRTMYWMVPEHLAIRFQPGMVVAAVGHPVVWSSTKRGKRLEWLQVKNLEGLSSGETPRHLQAKRLAAEGLLGRRPRREWPVDAARGSVRLHLVIGNKDTALPGLRHQLRKGRRFQLQVHAADMNKADEVALAVTEAAQAGGQFLLLVQQEADNFLIFDDPAVLRALSQNRLYTILVQPDCKVKPFGYWWVDEWLDNPHLAVQRIVSRCWSVWKGPREKERLKQALLDQTQKDRSRFASELSRLRRENSQLAAQLANLSPQRIEELEKRLSRTEGELKRSEERRRVVLAQLYDLEQERDDLKRKLALSEGGGIVAVAPADLSAEVEKARRQEEYRRMLVEDERDRLEAENKRLLARLEETAPLVVEELRQKAAALEMELSRSEERREQLSELLFLLEQENRELKGRLGFREELETPPEGRSWSPEEELLIGKARLYEEIHDLLIKEELERLQREVKRLRDLMESCSPALLTSLRDELEITRAQLAHSEALREELQKGQEKMRRELRRMRDERMGIGGARIGEESAAALKLSEKTFPSDEAEFVAALTASSERETKGKTGETAQRNREQAAQAPGTQGRRTPDPVTQEQEEQTDDLLGKAVEFFRHGFRLGRKR
ncbi:hypothetical protein HM1_3062 [Heliomicrobium modesticaldum Ice1]|uniref:Uncharacterized protein n=1 Tax=Heliobacterium modesticaldum (strain ATCC 51547 / Ice1) TaxID=498761 RepID=B0TDP2_HELMI|nr:hypothetical protein [Heliomicrobium modesticaldum]ABZ85567.1 hypothetical protein HM1_3062 [Heliomicrobium modesticaldum Ice1]